MDAKRKRKWLWVAAVLPFVSAVAVQATGSKVRPISDAAPRDPLAFEQYLVNLGSPPPRAEYAGRFAFRNVGSKPLVIQKLEPSCGCLNPRLEKKEFAPGEQGEFYLRVRAANDARSERAASAVSAPNARRAARAARPHRAGWPRRHRPGREEPARATRQAPGSPPGGRARAVG